MFHIDHQYRAAVALILHKVGSFGLQFSQNLLEFFPTEPSLTAALNVSWGILAVRITLMWISFLDSNLESNADYLILPPPAIGTAFKKPKVDGKTRPLLTLCLNTESSEAADTTHRTGSTEPNSGGMFIHPSFAWPSPLRNVPEECQLTLF